MADQPSRFGTQPATPNPGANDLPAIVVTRRDYASLVGWLNGYAAARPSPGANLLRRELLRAVVVEGTKPIDGIAAMHTQTVFRDDDTGRERAVTLVYPHERGATADALSVLTSLGAALIGLAEGQSIAFSAPNGSRRRVTVLKVRPVRVAVNNNTQPRPAG